MALLSIEDCWKGFNERVLLRGVDLRIAEGERVGLLGLNGSGKSTLLGILAGVEPLDRGTRTVRRDLRLGYLEQAPALDPERTAREAVRAGLGGRERVLADLARVHVELESAADDRTAALLARHGRLEAELERFGGHDVEHRIEHVLHSLGLDDFDARCGTLSGGERRRVALARLLLGAPELLLLDEPTNHLDALVTDWLEDWFLETRTPLLLVTHDRYFLDRVVDRIVELDRGELHEYAGGYGDYLEARAARMDVERKTEGARQNLLRRETEWMRRGPPARTTKAKARIHRYENLVDAAPVALSADLEFEIPPGPRLGARVVRLVGASKRFGERVVLPKLDLEIAPGTRLCIVGPNGAGKTTLVRLLLGELELDSGTREVGETVRFASIDQMRTDLDPTNTVVEEIAGRNDVVKLGDRTVRIERFLDRFGFPVANQSSSIAQLSGGERNRVLLAKLVLAGGNVLVLDEPTNDLDLATLRALEEALLVFPGAVIAVSHDRWFLDRIATKILYLDGHGGARLHDGDFSGLMETLAREAGEKREVASEKSTPTPPTPSNATRVKRIAPWEQRELDEVEAKIAALEAEAAALDARLSAPELYQGPKSALDQVTARRTALQSELPALYARWETLESLRSPPK
ncbi:MAG: ATP-binding cassette domain-containing protein [Planctomycetes bacterium]|nr:ATP-binding cassette domain-containing protein [Planctomycetota bacterium]